MRATERGPAACPNGHPLVAGNVTVGWLPCLCAGGAGHRTWYCWTCRVTMYAPPHDPAGDHY